MWWWILGACAVAYATKALGFLIPAERLDNPHFTKVAATMTIGLLASLIVMNAFADGRHLRVDARLGALLVALLAFRFRVPYLVAVILGALTAALLRLGGLG